MTRRHDMRGRAIGAGRHVRLYEWFLASEAWQSLDSVARSLYIEVARRYRGPDSNNGKIPYSVREAAMLLRVGKTTANKAFLMLIDRGFIVLKQDSGFNRKGRVAREWLLTEFADDTRARSTPTKEFMRWRPGISFNSAPTGTDSAPAGTEMYPVRDAAA